MTHPSAEAIEFVRLPTIPLDIIAAHMSDPRVTAHMPLATAEWTDEFCAAFVEAKEACWQRDGLGHWAFLADGAYVGWGGFQKEGEEWDFGLVLTPDRFGIGLPITRKALAFAREEPLIPYVTFLLPPSRKNLRGLDRLGAVRVAEVDYEGETFFKYRLETSENPRSTDGGPAP